MCSAAGRGRWPVARPSGTPCGRRAPDGAPGETPATAAGTRCGWHVVSASAVHVPWDTPADARTTPRVGGNPGGVWCLHAARHRRSQVGARQAVLRVRGVPPPEGGVDVVSVPSGARGPLTTAEGARLPIALGASGSATPGVGGRTPSGRAPGREGQRVAWGCLRQGAVLSGPPRPSAQTVPPPWRLDEPRTWGVPCRTDAAQEVVQAAVVVVACADQRVLWRGHPAWV